MATNKTYDQVRQAFQSVAGISALEANDDYFFLHSLNRAAFKAWSMSEIWPRYFVGNEERQIVPFNTYNIVPYTETNLDTIGEFHRIYTADPYTTASTAYMADFIVDSNGARIVNPSSLVGDTVFVDYKKVWDGPYDEDSTTIPEEFVDYIIHMILSDFYSGDGQVENSLIAEGRAQSYLDMQLGRLSYTNRNPYKYSTYRTHTNHQARN